MSTDIRFVKLQSIVDKSEILIPINLVYGSAIIVKSSDSTFI